MRTNLNVIAIATCMLAGSAAAGPDFQTTQPHGANRAHAASDATARLEPLDVIPFAFDSAALDAVDQIQLAQAAHWLAAHADHDLVIAAHTDAAGSDEYNLDLAARRARAVRDRLVALGAPRDHMTLAVYGETGLASSDPYAAANRVAVLYAQPRARSAAAARTPATDRDVLHVMVEIRGQASNAKQ